MEIALQTLVLQNFMGGTFTLSANCEDVNIYGQNSSGKTRLASAISWLLFDKDSLGRSSFEIKNLDAEGQEEHGLEHSVEGTFCVDNNTLTLKKIYKEIWTKKRGSPKSIFTGNTTDHFIDGVPVQKKDYVAQVTELAGDESVFRLLTSPIAFPSLHWQKQRTLLLDICGDISDLQVIESNSELSPLVNLLAKYNKSKKPFDDLKAVIVSRRKEINDQLDKLPVRIDEVRLGLPDVTGLSKTKIGADIVALENTLNDAKAKLHGIDNGADIADMSKKLAVITSDIQRMEQSHYTSIMTEANTLSQEITSLNNQRSDIERRSKSLKAEIESKQGMLATAEDRLNKLRERWIAIDEEAFQDTTEDTCPACGQSLPYDRVEEARTKAREEFNQRKAERLADVEAQGKGGSQLKDRLMQEIMDLYHDLESLATTADISQKVDQLHTEYEVLKKKAIDYEGIAERKDLLIVKASLERDIQEARESTSIDRDAISQNVKDLQRQLADVKAQADLFPKRIQGEQRIEELKQLEKEFSAEFEELEKQLYLCDLFVRTKVSLLTDRINAKFELVKFKLFEVQVNGGLSECCMLTIGGVPYEGGLNNAARIQGGLDIIRTLQNYYNLKAPVIIDNRESVTEIPSMGCQIISLVVSPQDKVLRVERAAQSQWSA